jgi:hypothetical protein
MTFAFMTCALATCVLCACSSRAEELRFRFQPGDRYFLLFSTAQKSEEEVNDQQQITEQAIRLRCDLEITEVEEGGDAWAKYTYRQVAMKNSDSTGYNEFDSDVDVNRPRIPLKVLPWYVALDEQLYIKITPQGRITRINGLQAIITSAKSKILISAARNRMAMAFEAVDSLFTEAETKTILEDQLAVFPDPCVRPEANDIAVSEPSSTRRANQWERIKRIEESDMIMESVFRLAEGPASPKRGEQVSAGKPGPDPGNSKAPSRYGGISQGGIAVIDVNLVIKTADDAKEIVSSGIKTRREVWGQGQGRIEIDKSTGQIINKRLAYDWVDEIKAVSQGQVRRIPPVPKPVRTHVESTFQMIKRDSDKPFALPDPNKP